MPYKSEKIKIQQTEFDRRIKLSPNDKIRIKQYHKEGWSQRALAREFNVSRRLIQFIVFPEKHEENLRRRKESGGSNQYYSKEKQREYVKNHRRYKQSLHIEGKI